MSEVYVQMKLALPSDKADEFAKVLEWSDEKTSEHDVFSQYGKLGPGVEEKMRQSAGNDPDWVDSQRSPEEVLEAQGFTRKQNLVLLEFLTADEGFVGPNLVEFLSGVFSMVDVEVVDSFVYSEDEIEDWEDDESLTLEEDEDDDDE